MAAFASVTTEQGNIRAMGTSAMLLRIAVALHTPRAYSNVSVLN
jgi:hypothetical protein